MRIHLLLILAGTVVLGATSCKKEFSTIEVVDTETAANATGAPRISTANSRVSAWTIPTNEELMIARHTRSLL